MRTNSTSFETNRIEIYWDTSIVTYYLQQQSPPAAEKFIDDSLKEAQPCVSAITEIELLCWKTANEKDIEVIHHFVSDALVIELERPIKLKAAEIRKVYGIKLPDAVGVPKVRRLKVRVINHISYIPKFLNCLP